MNNSLGLLIFHEWGDDIVDRPDNSEELMTASIINYWRPTHGDVYYFDNRWLARARTFKTDPAFYYPRMRRHVYKSVVQPGARYYPELGYLLVRWRWDIGREDDDYILQRQREVIEHYIKTDTKIVIWDEDYKFTKASIPDWFALLLFKSNTDNVSVHRVRAHNSGKMDIPRLRATQTLHCPVNDSYLNTITASGVTFPYGQSGACKDYDAIIAYIGNNYDRDSAIDKWIKGFGAIFPNRVHVYGNWLKYNPVDLPGVVQHSKATKVEIEHIYRRSLFVPMIAKDIYFEEGHITPRLYEVLAGGSLPIGLAEFKCNYFYFGSEVSSSPEEFRHEWGDFDFEDWFWEHREMMMKQWNVSYDYVLRHVKESQVFNVEFFLSDAGIKK